MYIDYHLKFADEAQAQAVLFTEERPRYSAVDVIGIIYKSTGEMLTTDDGEVPEMAPLDGWHVNVRHNAEAPELAAYQVFPATPARVWA